MPPLKVLTVSLINELERIKQPFIVVLDDIQCIHNNEVNEFLKLMLKYPLRKHLTDSRATGFQHPGKNPSR
jgi:ATP/maltotriose-dependent transcriptional regulator MalT